MLHNRKPFFLFLFFAFFFSACSSTDKLPDNPSELFAEAEKYDKDERYEEALRRYNDLKNRFPYSNYAIRAELGVADCYYKQESYAEAQISYQTFRELHPRHPQIDYVIFKTGMSYFKQLPSSIDRDLTLATDAISSFNELTEKFPGSEYVKEAKENRDAARKMLAEKDKYIADFYFIRRLWEPALGRYEDLYNNFQGTGFESYALARAALSAKNMGSKEQEKKYFTLLEKLYPQSSDYADVKGKLGR